MKIAVIGSRGIPDVQGGIETHCENLLPYIAKEGEDVVIYRRKRYNSAHGNIQQWKGIQIVDLYSPHNKYLENIYHSFIGILKAWKQKVDLVHIHGIGPAMLTPLGKLLGMKVVVTHHGRDYNRKKWGGFAKMMLKTGERIGLKCSDAIICVSKEFAASHSADKYRSKITFIPNGITQKGEMNETVLKEFELEPRKIILGVGRLVQEKGFHDLIKAFRKAALPDDYKLVIVGDSDFDSQYAQNLIKQGDEKVIFTGRLDRARVAALYANAACFVLPSYHEGLPIVLLEAMSYNLPVVVSDIEENKLDEIPGESFFRKGDIENLSEKINNVIKGVNSQYSYNLSNYKWDEIASKTLSVYRGVMQK